MAIAKKCDICGALHESYNCKDDLNKTNGIIFVNVSFDGRTYRSHDVIDLCPRCMDSIRTHIDFLKTTEV